MEITKELLLAKANEWFQKEAFHLKHDGGELTARPISTCGIQAPVNMLAKGVLEGFINYLFYDETLNKQLSDTLKLPPPEA